MTKYRVAIHEVVLHYIEVEADSVDEAVESAYEMWDDEETYADQFTTESMGVADFAPYIEEVVDNAGA